MEIIIKLKIESLNQLHCTRFLNMVLPWPFWFVHSNSIFKSLQAPNNTLLSYWEWLWVMFAVSSQTYLKYIKWYHFKFQHWLDPMSAFIVFHKYSFLHFLFWLFLILVYISYFHSIDQATNHVRKSHILCVVFHSILPLWFA